MLTLKVATFLKNSGFCLFEKWGSQNFWGCTFLAKNTLPFLLFCGKLLSEKD